MAGGDIRRSGARIDSRVFVAFRAACMAKDILSPSIDPKWFKSLLKAAEYSGTECGES